MKITSLCVCFIVLALLAIGSQAKTFSMKDLNANRAKYNLPMLTGNPNIDQQYFIRECRAGIQFSCTFIKPMQIQPQHQHQHQQQQQQSNITRLPPLGEFGAGTQYQSPDEQIMPLIMPLCPLGASQEETARCERQNQAVESNRRNYEADQERRHERDLKQIEEDGQRQIRKIERFFR
jgi:hypothetical protein